jgi:uncharacterized 2Fe-2S/4Fe-4S cluster protein (DUF4445 family)
MSESNKKTLKVLPIAHRSSLIAQHCSLALDLGTTSLVGRLLTADGTVLAESHAVNPQRVYGADILTRLQRAREGAGEELQKLLVAGMQTLVAALLAQADCPPGRIARVAAAGNPGICHLFRGLPVESLIHPPHRSPLTALTSVTPADLNLGLPVPLQLFPAVSGFVGGDLVAVLYGFATHRSSLSTQHGVMVLDLGTNAEIALWTGTRWLVTSVAAGPAFEAGNIACGMPLAPGAVTDVQLRGDRLELTVAGNGRPAGLCGSGLLALIAAARQGGLIDAGGRIVAPIEVGTNLARYLVADGERWQVCFHRDARGELSLTQNDVRQLQLAKGAVRAGVEVLLDRAALEPKAVKTILITGAFGAALPQAAVKGIAMLPEGMVENPLFVPNGVLDGLAAFLADPCGPERLQTVFAAISPLPLSGTPAFEKRFLASLDF